MNTNQSSSPRLNPDELYIYCLTFLRGELPQLPTLSSTSLDNLLWLITLSTAHAIEIAGRVFGSLEGSDPLLVPKRIAPLVFQNGLPSKGDLYDLWYGWDKQYTAWPLSDTLNVPLYFCLCLMHRLDCHIELNKRFQSIDRPVFRGLMGMTAGPIHPDHVRLKRFFDAMDVSLKSTVARSLRRSQPSQATEAPTSFFDEENIALAGATERLRKAKQISCNYSAKRGRSHMDLDSLLASRLFPYCPYAG